MAKPSRPQPDTTGMLEWAQYVHDQNVSPLGDGVTIPEFVEDRLYGTQWQFADPVEWASGTSYSESTVVSYNDVFYVATQATTGDTPDAGGPWRVIPTETPKSYVDSVADGLIPTLSTQRLAISEADSYAATPSDDDFATLDGPIDLRADVAPDTWAPANIQSLITRYSNVSTNRSWGLFLSTNGSLFVQFTSAGGGPNNTASTESVPFAVGERGQVRAVIIPDNGSGNSEVRFYTRPGPADSWGQLGQVVTGDPIGPLDHSNLEVRVGGSYVSGRDFYGSIFAAEARDGIDGTAIVSVDFTGDAWEPGADSATDAGRTWSLTSGTELAGSAAVLAKDGQSLPVEPAADAEKSRQTLRTDLLRRIIVPQPVRSHLVESALPAIVDLPLGEMAISTVSVDVDSGPGYLPGTTALRATMAADTTGQIILTPDQPIAQGPSAIVGMAFYVDDPAEFQNILLEMRVTDGAGSYVTWSGNSSVVQLGDTGDFRQGWNIVRWRVREGLAAADVAAHWGNGITRLRILPVTVAGGYGTTSCRIGKVWVEATDKARLIFTQDGGYQTFLDLGFPEFAARDLPITWAVAPGRFGAGSGETAYMTEAAFHDVALVNRSEVSFHSWDVETTSNMTAEEIREQALRAQRWIQAAGYPRPRWRAAFTQNDAPEHAAIREMVMAYSARTSSITYGSWPFHDPWSVPRRSLYGSTFEADIDEAFDTMKATHSLDVYYTHGIGTASFQTTQAQLDYFMGKLDTAIAEGWLEGTTFADLLARSGIPDHAGGDGWLFNLYAPTGPIWR